MVKWTSDELTRIGQTEEVQIAALRRDGSLRHPVTVWVVRHGNRLYVRSVNGPGAAWFQAAQDLHAGRLRAGAIDVDITFIEIDHEIDDVLDAEYRTKYQRYAASILAEITSRQARRTTLEVRHRHSA